MSSASLPKREKLHDLSVSTNGYDDFEISSIEHTNSGLNTDQNGSSIPLNEKTNAESIILDDETLSVEVSYTEGEIAPKDSPVSTPQTTPNRDLQKVQSSPKSSLYHQRKEAIKGYVLSKLAKKPSAVSDISSGHPPDIERRTLFSGFKEKLARKLEDNTAKETTSNPTVVVTPSEKNTLSADLHPDLKSKSECELKSVVANELGGESVEEGEECFEEIKRTLREDFCSVDSDKLSFNDTLTPPVLGTPRSRTLSNITETSKMVNPGESSNNDKSLSFSFSDLQKADDLLIDDDHFKLDASSSSNVPEIQIDAYTDPLRSPPSIDSVPDEIPSDNRSSKPSAFEYISSHLYIILFKSAYGFVVLCSVAVYWLQQWNHLFLAGTLCGLTIALLLYLLISEIVCLPGQENVVHFPDYKTLPPLTIPASPYVATDVYEGWMNQLFADYDSETFKLLNTVSVYVRLEGTRLRLSYPKKQVPKRKMWNEVLPSNNSFIKENRYRLIDAKVTLPPDDITKARLFVRRFPIRITLSSPPERQRSPSVDCSSLAEEKPLPSPTKSNGQSLPTSLSGSPIHAGADKVVLHLFPRTDREKEEWYWRFYRATQVSQSEVSQVSDDYLEKALGTQPSSSGHSTSADYGKGVKQDKLKVEVQKPILNFNDYMGIVMKDVPDEVEDKMAKDKKQEMPSLEWLNIVLGRLFFDFLTRQVWSDMMQAKIQKKLKRLKVPSYMQELVCTDVCLGASLPKIRRTSQPMLDERGLWLDLDIDFSGSFKVTLETKIKFQLPEKRESTETTETKDSSAAQMISGEIRLNEDFSELTDDDDDDLPDSEASKEESTPRHIASTSTGTKLLLTMERWVISSNIAENKFVKKCVGHITQTPILLTAEVKALCGTLAVNLPPPPSDRVWFGFRKKPHFSVIVCPKVGERNFNYTAVQKYIEKKLHQELEKALVLPNMNDVTIPLMYSPVYQELQARDC